MLPRPSGWDFCPTMDRSWRQYASVDIIYHIKQLDKKALIKCKVYEFAVYIHCNSLCLHQDERYNVDEVSNCARSLRLIRKHIT